MRPLSIKRIYYDIRRVFSNICFRIRQRLGLPSDVDFKYIEIVFENCNWVRIPSRLVDGLFLDDISENVWTNFCQQFVNTKHCKEFQIILKNDALKVKTNLEKEFNSDISTFERHIKVYKDITHILIKPNKGKKLYIAVPYKTKSIHSDINLLQKNKFEKDTFTVSSKKRI